MNANLRRGILWGLVIALYVGAAAAVESQRAELPTFRLTVSESEQAVGNRDLDLSQGVQQTWTIPIASTDLLGIRIEATWPDAGVDADRVRVELSAGDATVDKANAQGNLELGVRLVELEPLEMKAGTAEHAEALAPPWHVWPGGDVTVKVTLIDAPPAEDLTTAGDGVERVTLRAFGTFGTTVVERL